MKSKNIFHRQTATTATAALLLVLTLLLLSGCNSQAAPKMKRVGVLSGFIGSEFLVDSLKAEMAALGYVEGENIEYDVEAVGFDVVAYQNVLQRFVDEEVDVMFVFPTEATVEAKAITAGTNIPVVFAIASIDGLNIINSIREPGGNITGVRYPLEIVVSRYEVLRQLVPDARQLLIPHQRGYPSVATQLEALRPLAAADGVTLIEMPVDNAAELEAELQKLAAKDDIGVDAILILSEPLFAAMDTVPLLTAFAAEHELPIGGAFLFAEAYRSMFGIDIDFTSIPADAAPLIDKILQGVSAGSIPVASSEPFFMLDAAQIEEMGIEIPQSLMIMADFVYRGEPFLPPEGEFPEGEE